jgi:hypothetical protein
MQGAQVSFPAGLGPGKAPALELAHILRSHGENYLQTRTTNPEQRKVIRDIIHCRTPTLGGHLESCEEGCGYERLSFHSCRNRHCPKCQNLNKVRWLCSRSRRLLPTSYFHVVLTLPHQLNPLLLRNPRRLYNLLFQAASQALLDLAQGWPRLQALPGFTAVLHSWNQDLQLHVHLHIVATAWGTNPESTRWIRAKNNFLVPVRALAKLLRGKFLDSLEQACRQGNLCLPPSLQHPAAFKKLVRNLRRIKWYAYTKPPLDPPKHVFSYLGHYTHRTAISNQRLVAFDGQTVTFRARNNHQPGTYRLVRLPTEEFIRRFLLHVLPDGFVRIRHFGLMAPRHAQSKLEIARQLLLALLPTAHADPPTEDQPLNWQQLLLKLTGIDLTICPNCGGTILRKPLPETLRLTALACFSIPPLDTS